MKPVYAVIPVAICEHALINNKINQLKLYVYLKHIASGHIKFNNRLYEVWSSDLGVSSKTIKNSIKWLIQHRWITINSKSNSYRIISYKQLCSILKIDKIKKLKSAKYDADDFTNFKGFCCGAVITYYINRKRFFDRKNKWPGSKMDGSSTSRYKGRKGFYTLPVRYLSKCINVSNSTANNYKQEAIKAGYLIIKRSIQTLVDNKGNNIGKETFTCIAKTDEDVAGRLRLGRKYIKIVEPDFINSSIKIKRKRSKYSGKKVNG